MVRYVDPVFEAPFRVLLQAAATQGWYQADVDAREKALDELSAAFHALEAAGARLLGSMDDDYFATGQPMSLPYSIYALYDADDLGPVVDFVHRVRSTALTRYFRVEARVGRRLFLLDR